MSLGSGGGRSVCLWRCCLLSVSLGEQASGRRWDCSGLGLGRRCFGTKWYDDVPGARSTRDGDTAMRTTAVLPWQAACGKWFGKWQKFGDSGPYKNLDFQCHSTVQLKIINFINISEDLREPRELNNTTGEYWTKYLLKCRKLRKSIVWLIVNGRAIATIVYR